MKLFGADMSEANLSGVWFNTADLQNANLSKSDLSGTIFYSTRLRGTQFQGAYFCNTHLAQKSPLRLNFNTAGLNHVEVHKESTEA